MWLLDIFAGREAKREARVLKDRAIKVHGPKAQRYLEHKGALSDRKQVYRIAIRMLKKAPPA